MKKLIKKILKEEINTKVTNLVLDRLTSGRIKPPYFRNLNDIGLSYEEIKYVMETYLGGKLTEYYDNSGRIRKNGKIIYDEYSGGTFVKNRYSDDDRTIYTEYPDKWVKREYDENGNLIYRETSNEGVVIDNR